MGMSELRDLVRTADAVVIPVIPSAFDVRATTEFLKSFTDLKPIRKHKKPFALVRNRCRTGSRAVRRLDDFMLGIDAVDIGWLADRSLYNEVAWKGLGVFDLHRCERDSPAWRSWPRQHQQGPEQYILGDVSYGSPGSGRRLRLSRGR